MLLLQQLLTARLRVSLLQVLRLLRLLLLVLLPALLMLLQLLLVLQVRLRQLVRMRGVGLVALLRTLHVLSVLRASLIQGLVGCLAAVAVVQPPVVLAVRLALDLLQHALPSRALPLGDGPHGLPRRRPVLPRPGSLHVLCVLRLLVLGLLVLGLLGGRPELLLPGGHALDALRCAVLGRQLALLRCGRCLLREA